MMLIIYLSEFILKMIERNRMMLVHFKDDIERNRMMLNRPRHVFFSSIYFTGMTVHFAHEPRLQLKIERKNDVDMIV